MVGKSDFNENPVVSLDLDFDLGFVNIQIVHTIVYSVSPEDSYHSFDAILHFFLLIEHKTKRTKFDSFLSSIIFYHTGAKRFDW